MTILISDRYEKVTHVASSHQGKENSGVNLKHKSLDLMFFFPILLSTLLLRPPVPYSFHLSLVNVASAQRRNTQPSCSR